MVGAASGYRGGMGLPAADRGRDPIPEATPRAIRAALSPAEAGQFDSEFRQAMAEATEALDLTGVLKLLQQWQKIAWSASADPEAHARMLENADRLRRGEDVATEPWHVTKARLGL